MSKKKNKKKKIGRAGCETSMKLEHLARAKVKVGTHAKHLLVYGLMYALSEDQPDWSIGGELGGPSDTYEVEAVISAEDIPLLNRFLDEVVDKHEE